MAHINLLPWREGRRAEHKKNYLTLLAALALSALGIMFAAGNVLNKMTENQNYRNNYIEQETALLDQQIEQIKNIKKDKEAIEQRMALIEQLESSRNAVPIVLDELVRLVPHGLSFRSFSRQGNLIEILGVSESNNRLADFMRQLEESTVFSSGELSSIKADTSALEAVSDFKLTFTINPSVAPDFSIINEEPSK
ncbi:PilN domain-containing protein [Paraglaciecola psychrophila]|jgi:type IV pilus assembly protein PilN|uniref:Fimbrial assembly family protein n=1 Tax=Paraglaciecola psychrophila 170 TaxID=1129794 RepID=K6ZTY5_9ALTE|nr:PilN domain-containing protein [Paraglaciecola psychrophila]AGH47135.1 fimbrial assembly family protein [Paraglaciecola psychrophila 170]GAC39336.1 type IV pilus assembly protein PilN [Paraglaciecola psychrophila 170]